MIKFKNDDLSLMHNLSGIPHDLRLKYLRNRDKLSGCDWVTLILKHKYLSESCDWVVLGGDDWSKLLTVYPEFSIHCDNTLLSSENWANLIVANDDFIEHGLPLLEIKDWVNVLKARPELMCEEAVKEMSGELMSFIFMKNPDIVFRYLNDNKEWFGPYYWWTLFQLTGDLRFLDLCDLTKIDKLRVISSFFDHPEFKDIVVDCGDHFERKVIK